MAAETLLPKEVLLDIHLRLQDAREIGEERRAIIWAPTLLLRQQLSADSTVTSHLPSSARLPTEIRLMRAMMALLAQDQLCHST